MQYLVDTDICSYALKGHVQTVLTWRRLLPAAVGISAITAAELRIGAKRRSQRLQADVDRFVASANVLPFGAAETYAYADIGYLLERVGSRIGVFDLLIAAQAIANNLVLVTNNEREFRRVPGLKIENWSA